MSAVEPKPGDLVGEKYLLEEVLGRGGMGVVYRARHRITDRVVALKWLLEDDEQRRSRFLREARAMGRLSHPNVVGVLDVGDHEGAIFLVMDHLEGKSLRELMNGSPVEPAAAIELLMPALCGVAAAHQAGILHRDLKPENIFVVCDRDGTPFDTKVLDFGVAKPFGQDHGVASLTHSGAIVGTPRYMAPEQLGEEAKLDPRCDVYAVGLIFYELVTGQLPYRARALNALLIEILMGTVRPPRELVPELPEELAAVVMKALARDRDERYPDVASFARALEPWGEGVRYEAPRGVHTPRSGETHPGLLLGARKATDSGGASSSAKAELSETRSERPQPSARAATPESLAATLAVGEDADSQSEPNRLAASIARPSRRPIVATAVVALLVIAALAIVSAAGPGEPPSEPSPAPVSAHRETPVRSAAPSAPVEVGAPVEVARDPSPEIAIGEPGAGRGENADGDERASEPVVAPERAPPSGRARPRRAGTPETPVERAAGTAPGVAAPVRVDTRAGTLHSDDF